VAIITKLKVKPQESHHKSLDISVSVTHLKAKQGFEDLRLSQGAILLQNIENYLKPNETLPVIVAGDFNDNPNSFVYNLFSTGKAKSSHQKEFHSPYQLKSSYKTYDDKGIEPYTTYKKREVEIVLTIDYIWYSPQLVSTKCLEIPTLETFVHRLPCAEYPSDHLMIMAEFAAK